MSRISRHRFLINAAELVAQRGTCERKKVGSLAVVGGRIIATGYNGAPSGISHCVHDLVKENDSSLGTYPGCQEAVHAEANLISFAARQGITLEGSDLYCTCAPCLSCAQLILNAGFVRVLYGESYRNDEGIQLLKKAKVIAHKWRLTE